MQMGSALHGRQKKVHSLLSEICDLIRDGSCQNISVPQLLLLGILTKGISFSEKVQYWGNTEEGT